MNDRITTIVKKIALAVSFLFLFSQSSIGQETANWYFGSPNLNPNTGIRIDFSSGSPVVSNCNPINTEEGSSSISTSAGVPLFYTDGSTVWDASNNSVVPGGTGLGGNTSTTQSAIIMPITNFNNQWLIFTSGVTGGGFKYYKVTGTTPTGPFSVSAGTTMVGAGIVGEGLFIIGSTKSATSAYWVIGRDLGTTGGVRAWEVDKNGNVSATAQTSTLSGAGFTNTNYNQNIGTIKSNTCQNMLAFTYFNGVVDVTGFDASTGLVTATAKQFSVGAQSYGIEFSNNDQYLYASSLSPAGIYRYTIASSTVTSIGTATGETGQLQMAPDGKIYVARNTGNAAPSYLGVISNPDGGGSWTANGLLVSSPNCGSYNGWCYRGLPTFPKSLVVASPILSPGDAGYCVNASVPMSYIFAATDVSRTWTVTPATGWSYTSGSSTSVNPTVQFTTAGTYKVKVDIVDNCSRHYYDSMNITVTAPKIPAGIIDCGTSNITLEATGTPTSEYPNYTWYDAAAGGNVLGVGSPVALNYGSIAASPTSVWVEISGTTTITSSGSNTLGPPTGIQTWGGRGTGNYSVSFTVNSDILTLKSFTATPQSAGGSFDVEIKNSSNAVVFTQHYTGAVAATPYTINVNAALPKGNYTVTLKNSGSIVWGGGNWTGGGNAQMNLPAQSPGTFGMANFTYDYQNFSTITSCTNRVKVDRKCLNVFPGDGTYCTNGDIPLSYTFEGTATGQTWSITPGVNGTDWIYTSGNSGSAAPTIRFLTANTYTVSVSVTDVSTVVYSKSMTLTVIAADVPSGTITCTSPSVTFTATGTPSSDYPNYVWYDAASGGNVYGVGGSVTWTDPDNSSSPSSVWVEIASSASSSAPVTNASVGPDPAYLSGASYQYHTKFDVLADHIKLNSFKLYPDPWPSASCPSPTNVSFTIEIRNSSNAIVYSSPYSATNITCGGLITIPVAADLVKGTGYTLNLLSFTSNAGSWRQVSTPYPVTQAGVATINGPTANYTIVGSFNITSNNYTVTHQCSNRVRIDRTCALPVELVSFTGINKGNKNILSWVTDMELNNDYFEVQSSSDGIHFVTIGKVQGSGNSTSIHEYTLTDYNPVAGINYYRLVQTDFNGQQSFGKIVKVYNGFTNASTFNASPNPSTESFTIRFMDREGGEFTVLDVLGQVLMTKTIDATIESIEVGSSLAKGAYVARFSGNNGIYTQLIIKE